MARSRTTPSAKFGRRPVRRSKYGAVRTVYNGVTYASRSEANYARYLDLQKKAGAIKKWEGQVKWPLIVDGQKLCTMIPDFLVYFPDGKTALVEVKGVSSAVYKLKVKLFRILHPNVDYRVIPAREALWL